MPMRERDVQEEIMRAVGALPYARIWRVTVGKFRRLHDDQIVTVGLPGMADLSGILACGRRLEIECKGPRGRLSVDQKRWRDMILLLGGEWLLGRSEDGVMEALEAHRVGCPHCRAGVSFFSGNGDEVR